MTEGLSLLVSALALIVSAVALVVAWNQNRKHKLIEVTLHFQEAYDKLEVLKKDICEEYQAEYWFSRYWNLQARQYEYWLNGFIPDSIFMYWMICRRHEFVQKELFSPFKSIDYNYEEGWLFVKGGHILKFHPYKFIEFVESVFNLEDSIDFNEEAKRVMLCKKCDLCGWRVKLECAISKYFLSNIFLRQ